MYSCVCLESLLSCAHSIAAGPLKSQYINMGNCFGTPPYNRNQYDYEGQQLNYFPIVRHNNLPFPYSYHNTYYPYYHNVVRAQPNTQLLPPCQSFSPAKGGLNGCTLKNLSLGPILAKKRPFHPPSSLPSIMINTKTLSF